MDAEPTSTVTTQIINKLPKNPMPLFPAVFDFNPSKYYFPHLPASPTQPRLSPGAAYLEQYANVLQKCK